MTDQEENIVYYEELERKFQAELKKLDVQRWYDELSYTSRSIVKKIFYDACEIKQQDHTDILKRLGFFK